MSKRPERRERSTRAIGTVVLPAWLGAGLAVALPLALYLYTMAPTVYGADSAELTTGAYVLGIVHAPGAPLYLLVAHLFTWLPIGDVGYRVNLLSGLCAAASCGFVYGIVQRLTESTTTALGTAWLLATVYYIWVTAVVAELYAPHVLILAALIGLGIRCREHPRPSRLAAIGLLFGLGLGNHMFLALTGPGLAWLLFAPVPPRSSHPEPRRAGRRSSVRATGSATSQHDPLPWHWIPLGALAAGLGTCIYLYLPIRAAMQPPYDFAATFGVDLTTLEGFLWMVSARMFENQILGVPVAEIPTEILRYARWLLSSFAGLGTLVGGYGLWLGLRTDPLLHRALLLMFTGHLGFLLTYAAVDKELMLGSTWLIWTIWTGVGARASAAKIRRWSGQRLVMSGPLLLLLLCATNLVINFRLADSSNDWSARERGQEILSAMPENAVFIGTWADVPLVEYLQHVEERRPDVDSVNIFFHTDASLETMIEQRLQKGYLVFTTVARLAEIAGTGAVEHPGCNCLRLSPRPAR